MELYTSRVRVKSSHLIIFFSFYQFAAFKGIIVFYFSHKKMRESVLFAF